jgi:GT2 family glycosyltransferase
VNVAVVIVNANAGKHLARALECLEQQTLRPARTIGVDNLSTDGSTADLGDRFPAIELVQPGENLGFAAGNNLAVSLASDCEWVALLNPDAFPEPTWLERLSAAADANPEYEFFGSRLVSAESPELLDGTGDMYHVSGMTWRRDHGAPVVPRPTGEVFSPCAAAALYRRDVFVAAGGFDESFFCYYEDSDLAFRLRLAGHRCLHVDDAVVQHVGSATTGRVSDFTVYHSFRNQVWTFAKNMPAPLLALYLLQHLVVNLLTFLAFVVHGQGRAITRAKWDALRGLPRILRERRRIQSQRRAGVRDLRALMAKGAGGFAITFFGRWARLLRVRDRPSPSSL